MELIAAMTLLDITVCLALAARIHDDPEKVRASAWRMVERTPYEKRWALVMVIESKNPLAVVERMLEEL